MNGIGRRGVERLGDDRHEERRCIDGAVVHRGQPNPGLGIAQFVQNRSGRFLGCGVPGEALATGKNAGGGEREVRSDGQHEPRSPERIATEKGEVPGGTRGNEDIVWTSTVAHQQCRHVVHRTGKQRTKRITGRRRKWQRCHRPRWSNSDLGQRGGCLRGRQLEA